MSSAFPEPARKFRIFCAISVLLLFFCVGCGSDQGEPSSTSGERAESSQQPARGGTAVIALNEDPDVLNGLIRRSASAGQILDLLSDNLPDMGEDLKWHPFIATDWDITPDRTSITYHMKPWVWSDGEALTAEDVVSSFELFRNPAVGSPRRGQYREVSQVTALDSVTVRYTFSSPMADPVARSYHALFPHHITRDLDPAKVMNWDLNRNPLSSGPFILEKWDHGRSLALVPNPFYPGEAPNLDRIIFKIIPDPAGRVVSLETGEVDFVGSLTPSDAKRLAEHGQIQIKPIGGRQYYYLNWNTRRPMFDCPLTRRALSLAIDRQRMIETLLLGYGRPAVGPIAPALWNFHSELTPDAYDPALAAQLLAQAGWTDVDGDGVLDRDGQRLGFEMLTKLGDPVRENGSIIIRENLREIGAEVNVRVLELATGLDLLKKGDFDAYFGSFSSNLLGDPSGVVHSNAIDQFNKGAFANAQVDSLVDLALSITDRAQALPYWHELQEVLLSDQPSAYLFYPEKLSGVGPRLQGVRPHLLSPFNNLPQWWIPVSDRKYRSGN